VSMESHQNLGEGWEVRNTVILCSPPALTLAQIDAAVYDNALEQLELAAHPSYLRQSG